jgi:exopolysaccharide biosynthesis protein
MTISKTSVIQRQNGLELKKFEISGGNMNTTIYAAIIDQALYSPTILGKSKSNPDGIRPAAIMEQANSDVKVILGSGFVENFNRLTPNGFLKVDGEIISELKNNGDNGIAGVRNERLQLIPSSSSLGTLRGGFQTGPFLIRDGKNVYNSLQRSSNIRANRSFVGRKKSGQIVAAVTEGEVSLNT